MRTVKSNAKRQDVGLTVPVATRDARRIVGQVMPDVRVYIESRSTYDPPTAASVIVTTVFFPPSCDGSDLACRVETMPGVVRSVWGTCSVTVTRRVH